MEIGAEAALFPEKEYISGIFVPVRDTNNGENSRNRRDVNNSRKANNSMYAKIEGTPATVGKPTAEGTTISMETAETEGMSTTAGPQQQQKRHRHFFHSGTGLTGFWTVWH
jgi:hypothetical protein